MGNFGITRPDYCKIRINKLKNFFKQKTNKTHDEPRFKTANTSEESIQKVKSFIRDNDVSEE